MSNDNVVNAVSAGEIRHDHIVIDRFLYFRDATGVFHQIMLAEDPMNPGIYILTDYEQASKVPTS